MHANFASQLPVLLPPGIDAQHRASGYVIAANLTVSDRSLFFDKLPAHLLVFRRRTGTTGFCPCQTSMQFSRSQGSAGQTLPISYHGKLMISTLCDSCSFEMPVPPRCVFWSLPLSQVNSTAMLIRHLLNLERDFSGPWHRLCRTQVHNGNLDLHVNDVHFLSFSATCQGCLQQFKNHDSLLRFFLARGDWAICFRYYLIVHR